MHVHIHLPRVFPLIGKVKAVKGQISFNSRVVYFTAHLARLPYSHLHACFRHFNGYKCIVSLESHSKDKAACRVVNVKSSNFRFLLEEARDNGYFYKRTACAWKQTLRAPEYRRICIESLSRHATSASPAQAIAAMLKWPAIVFRGCCLRKRGRHRKAIEKRISFSTTAAGKGLCRWFENYSPCPHGRRRHHVTTKGPRFRLRRDANIIRRIMFPDARVAIHGVMTKKRDMRDGFVEKF